jgi:hypothetical protein
MTALFCLPAARPQKCYDKNYMKSTNYRIYQGSDASHGVFWRALRNLPPDQHVSAFLDYYEQIKLEVDTGECTLREAGQALAPGLYSDSICRGLYAGGIMIACGEAENIAGWIYADIEEAWEDWRVVVGALDGLVDLSRGGTL